MKLLKYLNDVYNLENLHCIKPSEEGILLYFNKSMLFLNNYSIDEFLDLYNTKAELSRYISFLHYIEIPIKDSKDG